MDLLQTMRFSDRIHGVLHGEFRPPIMVDIDPVDGWCNLDCEWCCQAASRSTSDRHVMTPETMNGIAGLCQRWGVCAWRIAGDSEPTLNKQLGMLLDAGKRCNISMGLITNGTALHLHFESLHNLTWLGISLDATDRETWANLKNSSPDLFDRIIENVHEVKRIAPHLEITLKFLNWDSDSSLHKDDFGLPVLGKRTTVKKSIDRDAAIALAKSLGVVCRIKDAYSPTVYRFNTCRATPLGGVFRASHAFDLCCDARGHFTLTDDYTRDNFNELLELWGGHYHKQLIASIEPQGCPGCAKRQLNEHLERSYEATSFI